MSHNNLAQFIGQKYLNIESYRKNGQPVCTPVWFAEDNGVLYVYSLADAGKVKRIRRNPRVRITPCDMRGGPRGTWVEARARIVDAATAEHGHRRLNEKYGWMKRAGDFFSQLRGRERVVIAIEVV